MNEDAIKIEEESGVLEGASPEALDYMRRRRSSTGMVLREDQGGDTRRTSTVSEKETSALLLSQQQQPGAQAGASPGSGDGRSPEVKEEASEVEAATEEKQGVDDG